MVSIVIVSHSQRLAEGVLELVEQMTQGQVALAAAGGIDDPDHPIGTDPFKVQAAIEAVYSPDGVVVLMDLGSALLSTEMALEFLSPEQRPFVHLCEAPLVEGAVAAAVQAMTGAGVAQVMAEARAALSAKSAHLQPGAVPAPVASPAAGPPSDGPTLALIVPNRLGLHARPAARLVALANRFQAEVAIGRPGGPAANAKSINQVATLGARQGESVIVRAHGADADQALAAIAALAADNFGDVDAPASVAPAAEAPAPSDEAPDQISGVAASAGVAIGRLALYTPGAPEVITYPAADWAAEWARLHEALQTVAAELAALQAETARRVGSADAAIFEAHRLLVLDPDLHAAAREHLRDDGVNAEAAWQATFLATAARFEALPDPYLAARAADVRDVGQRVLRHMLGAPPPAFDFENPVILAAADLTPSDAARLPRERVLGLITAVGGATSHSAILARALGIPAVVGVGAGFARLQPETLVALDGEHGRIWLAPTPAVLDALRQQQAQQQAVQEAARTASQTLARLRDGRRIEVAANIGRPSDIERALSYGAEGVGLFRTEFLFMDRATPPDEEEQFQAYRTAAATLGARPLIIRTLDVGGDKPVAYIPIGQEDNPFLGWRGIRYCLDTPTLFKPQLRAICRASAAGPVRLMFPMIAAVEELRRARALVAEVQAELAADGIAYDPAMPLGVMIEVPSAVLIADQLAPLVDFFSLGTNDLTQYVMAADRGNAAVAGLADALQPAVLRAIAQTVTAGHAAGIWVGMCGELAGNALATPLLVGLGLDELSMSAPAIPAVKAALRDLIGEQAQHIAQTALGLDSAESVRRYLHAVTSTPPAL